MPVFLAALQLVGPVSYAVLLRALNVFFCCTRNIVVSRPGSFVLRCSFLVGSDSPYRFYDHSTSKLGG